MLPEWGNNMKMPAFFSAISQYGRNFKHNRNLLLMERIRICNRLFHRHFSPAKEKINIEDLYQIVGHVSKEYISTTSYSNSANHPIEVQKTDSPFEQDRYIDDWDSYIKQINEGIKKHNMENHIIFKENPDKVLISEKDTYYQTKYEITIKNLIINVNESRREMFFYPPSSVSPSASPLDSAPKKDGIYLIFENNHFVGKDSQTPVNFYPKENAYFIFKNNIFISVNLLLVSELVPKIELKGNIFMDSNMKISEKFHSYPADKNIICLDDNIFYRKDGDSSKLEVTIDCYFKGKNTVDNLILNLHSLHWGGYQNIDPQGKHAYTHKKMFLIYMKEAVKKNDKMKEARLRRELMKCERVLFQKEKIWHSWQDRFILWWSRWISDYGISWFRPIFLLVFINAFLASVVWLFFSPYSSWLSLFFNFFSPLNNLSNVVGIISNAWISFLNILPKAALAVCIYEMIKIFRRFSK